MSLKQFAAALTLSLSFASSLLAAEKPAAPATRPAAKVKAEPVDPRLTPPIAKLDLKDGDTIVFLGDSITHQCLYTQYLEDFFYTRFPNIHLRIHNAGVGGDRASDALARF